MAAAHPQMNPSSRPMLKSLGEQIRARRKAMRVSATAAAEAAGMSRVTWHRIENGEPSVSVGAWADAITALGLEWQTQLGGESTHSGDDSTVRDPANWLPVEVKLADYPHLNALAWQVHGDPALTPAEALDIYERNARHLNEETMSVREQGLLTALRAVFGRNASHV